MAYGNPTIANIYIHKYHCERVEEEQELNVSIPVPSPPHPPQHNTRENVLVYIKNHADSCINHWDLDFFLLQLYDVCAERLERGGPCWLLKLMQIGTQGVHMKGVLPWLALLMVQEICILLCCSSLPSKNYFFPNRTLFHFVCLIALQAWQAVVPRRLSFNMCLCVYECQSVPMWSRG